ncbi:MAG: prolyl oligopeptidase family serine peptidase [Chloroflexota bacterium]|nr:prolyl oligopeptidase family serine peptidase [Chloroflexota bacterium]MDQ5865385.1 prolyl oligopeptidase family serine peptidase [Chloroflexota bacterium]
MRRYEFEQYEATVGTLDLSFSPDGQWVAYTSDRTGILNVWKQPVHLCSNGCPQMPVQLTASLDRAASRAIWSGDGKSILTLADYNGTERLQICEVPPDQGWLYPITNEPRVSHEIGLAKAAFPHHGEPFSPDSTRIAYACDARSPKDFDVVVRDLETGETTTVFAEGNRNYAASWSPDGRYVLVVRMSQMSDHDLFLCDLETGEHRHLTPHEGSMANIPGPWQPDGSGFYFLTDRGGEFKSLAFYRLSDDSLRYVDAPDWDVHEVAISPDGRHLAWTVNENGYSRLRLRDLSTGDTTDYSDLPRGYYSCLRFSPVEPILGLYVGSSTGPENLHMLNVATGETWQLTQNFLGGIPLEEMVEPEAVRFPTFDERTVPAYLYKPKGVQPGERVPVIVSIHGGPEIQELPVYAYNGMYQYLLNRRIGVLAPNIRGSAGYGKTYQKLIYRDWGGGELKDLEHAALFLRGLDWVDPERLGVFGGSFGGFATLSCITRLPQYWAAAVDLVGPSNLVTLTSNGPPAWKHRMKAWVGDPVEDYDMLVERSPINYTDNIRAPLLVIQGANDPRVPRAESDQIVERLRATGKIVEYMLLEDEGHGAAKTSNAHRILKACVEWFEKYL